MSDLNQLALYGHITRDAVKTVVKDKALVTVSFANNYVRPGPDGKYVEAVSFFFIKLWGAVAEKLFPYLVKGQGITVEGRLQQRRWVDRLTNNLRSRLEIVPVRINLVGPRPGGRAGAAVPGGQDAVDAAALAAGALAEDDLDESVEVDVDGVPVAREVLAIPEDGDLRD
jgi:single-strand DNA-binding protein